MQKWEYLFANFNFDRSRNEWELSFVNGVAPRDKYVSLHNFANAMGSQGWELGASEPILDVVDHLADTKYGFFAYKYDLAHIRMVFKRPIP